MDRTKAQAVQAHLEALESLGKLFETLWLEQMKQEVQGEKARAYLTVFEDIFPSIYHVVAYAKKTMPLLQQGGGDLSLLEQEGGQLPTFYWA